jgi:hypothetical protein
MFYNNNNSSYSKMPRASNPEIVKSLLCFGRVILDQQCNLKAPTGSFEKGLSVDIGGSVNMMATTINFKNSTIDFDGATLLNFTGNISGNITGNINVDAVNTIVVNATKINGNLCGNVVAKFLEADLYTGCVCGDILTSTIAEKVGGGGITFNGNMLGDTVGTHFGPVYGDVCGAIVTDSITPKTGSAVTIIGDLTITNNTLLNGTVTSTGNVILSNSTTFFVGNVCGDIYTNKIHPKTVGGSIDMLDGNVIVSNIIGNQFYGNFYGNLTGNIYPLDTIGNFFGKFVGNSFGKFMGNVCGNIVSGNIVSGNIVSGNIGIFELITNNIICPNIIRTNCIETKTSGNIIVKSNTLFNERVTVLGNLVTANLIVSNSFKTPTGTTLNTDICGNIITDQITAKTGMVNIISPVVVFGNITTGFAFNGNLHGNLIGKYYGNICPGAGETAVGVKGGDLEIDGDMYIASNFLYISNTQILTTQQSTIAAATGSANSLTNNTGGTTGTNTVDDVSALGGTVTVPSGATPGGVTVTASAATDLNDARNNIAQLATNVNTRLGDIDGRLDDINDNFSEIAAEYNQLRLDVISVRTQLNLVITALKTHGLIAT